MKLSNLLEKWGMTSLKIKTSFLETELNLSGPDKVAAWQLYVELLTRITTQSLAANDGDEKTALDSIYSLFPTTRSIIKDNGRGCIKFTKIAVVVLNQKIRPFTAKWHRKSLCGGFDDPAVRKQFRNELEELQVTLRKYTAMLSDMAEVEDLTGLEE